MSFHRSKLVLKTRKRHPCLWCNQHIEAETCALSEAGIGEDENVWHGHMHIECGMARDAVLKKYGEWESQGDFARGRMDDDFNLPPQFVAPNDQEEARRQ
jgi:hypothetical protein